jgi:hypothetical protein
MMEAKDDVPSSWLARRTSQRSWPLKATSRADVSGGHPKKLIRTSHVEGETDGRRGTSRVSRTIYEVDAEASGECTAQSLFRG